jgi:hypothetical protein
VSGIKSLFEDFTEALATTSDLHDEHERARSYLAAGIDLKSWQLDEIREADRLAKETELARRISRS